MKLAVIPARGGSKRIPRKNIRSFCGKPIIAWSIEVARASGLFDRVIVSTDAPEIAEVAKAYGAEVPFVRPAELSDDHAGTSPVVVHAVEWARSQGLMPEFVCCVYPTAPFVRVSDLQRGLQTLISTGAEFAFSITSYAFPIQRAIKCTGDGRVEMFQPDQFNTRSQDLEEAFHDAGQFYWGRPDAWTSNRSIFSESSAPVMLPRHRVQDIDTLEDWERAELMFRLLHQSQEPQSHA
jgi:pseudaminic acid cytidylyltransferase